MPFEIPIPSHNAKWSETVTMDGTVYRLTFNWNTRIQAWYMQIAEQDGSPIVSGIKLLPMISLLQRHKDARLPPGVLFSYDVIEAGTAAAPSKSQLGSKMKLFYIGQSEFQGL